MMKVLVPAVLAVTAALGCLCLPACGDIEADALYVRRLPAPPGERDWKSAVPLRLMVGGGAVHRDEKPLLAQAVDQDTVHRNSASCHHGPSQRSSFPVWLRGYHDDRNIYLRFSWPDLTPDEEGLQWVRESGNWRLRGGGGDAVSLVFPLDASPAFSCALICHLDDWTLSGGRFQEAAKMRYAGEGQANLWLWRAGEGEPLDLVVDSRGLRPNRGPESLRLKNSRLEMSGRASGADENMPFGPRDGPWIGPDGRPLPDGYASPEGSRLPAYLPLPRETRGSTIQAVARYRNGLWEVTLVRPLATGDPRDILFAPGGAYYFGLSVMDDTMRNHHITDAAWKMKVIS